MSKHSMAWSLLLGSIGITLSGQSASDSAVAWRGYLSPHGLPILVSVEFATQENKTPMSFLVDTGSSLTVIDSSRKEMLGLPVRRMSALTAGSEVETDVFKGVPLIIGQTLYLEPEEVVCFDLSKHRLLTGCPVYGLLGMKELQKFVLDLNPSEASIALRARLEVAPKEFHAVPFSLGKRGQPQLRVQVQGQEMDFVIDTGANNTVLGIQEASFTTIAQQGALKDIVKSRSQTLGGDAERRKGVLLGSVSMGCYSFVNSPLSENTTNVIGIPLLSGFDMVLDFRLHQGFFKLRSNWKGRPKAFGLWGLSPLFKDGRALAYDVKPGGPAARSGIRKGDSIVKVGEIDSRALNLYILFGYLLAQQGKTINVAIERESELRVVSITLSSQLDYEETATIRESNPAGPPGGL